MEIFYNNSQWDPIRVCARKTLLRCINAFGCVKKRHAPRCMHKMHSILSVLAPHWKPAFMCGLEQAPLNTAVCHSNHFAITAVVPRSFTWPLLLLPSLRRTAQFYLATAVVDITAVVLRSFTWPLMLLPSRRNKKNIISEKNINTAEWGKYNARHQ